MSVLPLKMRSATPAQGQDIPSTKKSAVRIGIGLLIVRRLACLGNVREHRWQRGSWKRRRPTRQRRRCKERWDGSGDILDGVWQLQKLGLCHHGWLQRTRSASHPRPARCHWPLAKVEMVLSSGRLATNTGTLCPLAQSGRGWKGGHGEVERPRMEFCSIRSWESTPLKDSDPAVRYVYALRRRGTAVLFFWSSTAQSAWQEVTNLDAACKNLPPSAALNRSSM